MYHLSKIQLNISQKPTNFFWGLEQLLIKNFKMYVLEFPSDLELETTRVAKELQNIIDNGGYGSTEWGNAF